MSTLRSWMALPLKQPSLTQQDLISVGSIVLIRGRSSKYRVKAISKNRIDAWIIDGDTIIRWPVSDLCFDYQLDLFPKYPIFFKCDKNCHKNGFAGLAVLVTPPLSLTGETHAT